MALSSEERGFKRICTSCGTRFYDLGKRPIVCPNCSTEYNSDIKVRGRRGRSAVSEADDAVVVSKGKDKHSKSESIAIDRDEDVVSISELEEIENSDDDDIDLEDDIDDIDEDDSIDDDLDDDLDDLDADLNVDLDK